VPLIRCAPVVAGVRFLERSGAPALRIADAVDLPRAALADPEMLIPLHLCGRFAAEVARSEGIDDFGFRFAAESPLEGLGSFGSLLAQATSLREACDLAVRTRELFNSGARIWLAHEGDRVWLRQALDPRIEEGRRELEQFWAIKVLQLVRAAAGSSSHAVIELHLRSTEIRSARDNPLLSDLDVRFAQCATAISFPDALLRRSLRPGRAARPRSEFERRLAASRPAADFASSVRQVASTLLEQGYPDVRRVASAIGLSARTLQRRLAEAGASYSRLVESERFARAIALLRDAPSSITGVALALGYRDLASFTHAFRRWTGESPREFRRRAGASTLRERESAAAAAAAQ
jgi:AraC-like DNA-binding protein